MNSVINKTGEVFNITRDEKNHIISISGVTSGTANFRYSKGVLTYAQPNNHQGETYTYDSEGNLTSITTDDGECMRVGYEYYSKLKKKMVSEIIDPEGNKESFVYNQKNHTVTHKTYSGNIETYQLDDLGATTAYKNEAGVERRFLFNEENLIKGIYENKRFT